MSRPSSPYPARSRANYAGGRLEAAWPHLATRRPSPRSPQGALWPRAGTRSERTLEGPAVPVPEHGLAAPCCRRSRRRPGDPWVCERLRGREPPVGIWRDESAEEVLELGRGAGQVPPELLDARRASSRRQLRPWGWAQGLAHGRERVDRRREREDRARGLVHVPLLRRAASAGGGAHRLRWPEERPASHAVPRHVGLVVRVARGVHVHHVGVAHDPENVGLVGHDHLLEAHVAVHPATAV
mmetsp:Transcript_57297/g.159465  ORF Transcript_57297/g.159465 Transcript_57297/m.159465 type:complete len:241 (-) Transcript_57297:529-1251(-)